MTLPLPIRAAITGVHGYVPDYVLTNGELARMVDTSDAWITERTGIKERRILKGEGLGTSHMGAEAVRSFRQTAAPIPDREIVAHGFFPLSALPADITDGTRARIAEALDGKPATQRW